ncbi:hypothetical protein [Sorangium sp. So ce131]|uniref:hypothetical protein n=1 Tax=Sorangium sp. So ce131 TaxID=3133282 RepID=UPI003F603FE2
MIKSFGLFAAASVFLTAGITGCQSPAGGQEAELGSISLPLAAHAPSGVQYRLRNATFEIRDRDYVYGGAGGYDGGYGGWDPGPQTVITVDSEDYDPEASSILVDLERGPYNVRLLPGWSFDKIEDGTATNVEATLLSQETVYIYVSPHSTSWAQYNFGIGDSSLWLNGKLNLDINVYDDPDQYYGGAGGSGGEGGYSTGGGWGGVGGAGGGGW